MTRPSSLSWVSTASFQDRLAWVLLFLCPAFFASNMVLARAMAGVFSAFCHGLSSLVFCGLDRHHRACAFAPTFPNEAVGGMALIVVFSRPRHGAMWRAGLSGGEYTSATNIGLIYSAAPLVIALLAYLKFNEALRRRQILGLFLGLTGVVTIIIKGDLSRLASLTFNEGDLLIVMATIAFAVYSLGLRYIPTQLTQFERFGAMALGGGLWHIPAMLAEIAYRGPCQIIQARSLAPWRFWS